MKENKFLELASLLRSLYGSTNDFLFYFTSYLRFDEPNLYTIHDDLGKIIEVAIEYDPDSIYKYFYFEKYDIYIEISGFKEGDDIEYHNDYAECSVSYEIKKTYKPK